MNSRLTRGSSLLVQGLRSPAPSARGMGLILIAGQGTKISHATWYSKKKEKERKKKKDEHLLKATQEAPELSSWDPNVSLQNLNLLH